ncbi:MAG: ABC transporter substrate-binding protein [Chitinophagaceae bacterium]
MATISTERNCELESRRRFIKEFSIWAFAVPIILSCNRHLHPSRIVRIGFFSGVGFPELEDAFLQELKKLGFREGKNIQIERRFTRPNTNDSSVMAAELANIDLAFIVAVSLPLALEVRKANPRMPMVIGTCPGMVSNGFAHTLERPGGIYTGLDELPPGITSMRLHLLKTAAPKVSNVALLSTTPGKGGHDTQLSDAVKAAGELGIKVKPYRATSLPELEKALENLVTDRMNGMLCFQGVLSVINRKLITDYVAEHGIPSIYQATLIAEAGGLMAWAPDLPQQFREVAHYVAEVLKGAKPGDLPVKHPEKYYLTLNANAAKKIGLTFPPDLLAQATRVLT